MTENWIDCDDIPLRHLLDSCSSCVPLFADFQKSTYPYILRVHIYTGMYVPSIIEWIAENYSRARQELGGEREKQMVGRQSNGTGAK